MVILVEKNSWEGHINNKYVCTYNHEAKDFILSCKSTKWGPQRVKNKLKFKNKLKIEEKQRLFAIRNRMIDIPNNFGKSELCSCGEQENMVHVYSCKHLNKTENIHSSNLHYLVST